jgi:hypothetical protein
VNLSLRQENLHELGMQFNGRFWERFPSDKTIPAIVLDREFLPASTKLCSAAHHPKTQPESC